MNHTFYPQVHPTVTPLRVKALRVLRWLVLAIGVVLLLLAVATVIAQLHQSVALQESAFLQGMTTGVQLCGRGT